MDTIATEQCSAVEQSRAEQNKTGRTNRSGEMSMVSRIQCSAVRFVDRFIVTVLCVLCEMILRYLKCHSASDTIW
jgi:hypothetical protein